MAHTTATKTGPSFSSTSRRPRCDAASRVRVRAPCPPRHTLTRDFLRRMRWHLAVVQEDHSRPAAVPPLCVRWHGRAERVACVRADRVVVRRGGVCAQGRQDAAGAVRQLCLPVHGGDSRMATTGRPGEDGAMHKRRHHRDQPGRQRVCVHVRAGQASVEARGPGVPRTRFA